MEFESKRSPTFTVLEYKTPSGIIFSSVLSIYFAPAPTSPIFIQLTPFFDVVIYSCIGRGEPPLNTSITFPRELIFQLIGIASISACLSLFSTMQTPSFQDLLSPFSLLLVHLFLIHQGYIHNVQ